MAHLTPSMTQRILIIGLAAALAFSLGACRSSKKPKETNAIASEMEANFKQRWLEKRVGELTQSGKTADVARAQAEKEFAERYDFTRPNQKSR